MQSEKNRDEMIYRSFGIQAFADRQSKIRYRHEKNVVTVKHQIAIPVDKETTLHCDLMFDDDNIFFVSVTDFGLTISKRLNTKGTVQLARALGEAIGICKRNGWHVNAVVSDGEKGIQRALEIIDGPPHEARGAGEHDGRVEERIRRIKEVLRSLLITGIGAVQIQFCYVSMGDGLRNVCAQPYTPTNWKWDLAEGNADRGKTRL
jgi:hypothetical protein